MLIILSTATFSPPHQACGESVCETPWSGRVVWVASTILTENTDAATHTPIKGGSNLIARIWMITSGTGMFRAFGETMSPAIA